MPDMRGTWGEPKRDAWEAQREALGAFIREGGASRRTCRCASWPS